jgi:hypothetical protein
MKIFIRQNFINKVIKKSFQMWLPNLLLILLCSIHLPGKYLLIKLSEKGKKQSCTQEVAFFKMVRAPRGG